MLNFNKLKLVNKIFIITLSLIIFFSIVITWNEIKYTNAQIDKMKQEMPNKIINTWQQLIQNTSILYMASATVIADIPLVSNAYLMENRKILEQLTNTIQNDIYKRQAYPIYIHFHEIRSSSTPKSFLKLWDKENFGEDLSHRNIISYSYNRMTSIGGIDKEKNSLIITGISPIKFGDKAVGSVEVFSDIQFITNELSKITNANILLYLKDEAQKNNFILIAKNLLLKDKLNTHNKEIEEQALNIVDKSLLLQGSMEQIIKIHDNTLLLYTPLIDFQNQNVGTLVSQIDITEINDTANKNILQTILKSLIITSIICILIYLLIQKNIQQPLANLTNRIQELSTKELDLIKTIEIPQIYCAEITNCNQQNCTAYKHGGHCWMVCGSFSDNKNCNIMNTKRISCITCDIFKRYSGTELDKITTFLNIFTIRIKKILKKMISEIKDLTINISTIYNISNQSLNIKNDEHAIIGNKLNNVGERLKLICNNLEEINNQWNKLITQNSTNNSLIKNDYDLVLNSIDKTMNNISSNINNFASIANTFEELINKIVKQNGQTSSPDIFQTKEQMTQNLINIKTLSEDINIDIRKHINLMIKNGEFFNKMLKNDKDMLEELQKNMEELQKNIKLLIAITDDINTIKLQNTLTISTIEKMENNISKIHYATIKSQETIANIKNSLGIFKIDTL